MPSREPMATGETEIRRITVRSQPGQIVQEILSRKYPTQKRAGRVAQVVEHLPSKYEALSSNSSTEKKKKERERERKRDVKPSGRSPDNIQSVPSEGIMGPLYLPLSFSSCPGSKQRFCFPICSHRDGPPQAQTNVSTNQTLSLWTKTTLLSQ
jgi:hypothetical protein